jgi:hypothetical protein
LVRVSPARGRLHGEARASMEFDTRRNLSPIWAQAVDVRSGQFALWQRARPVAPGGFLLAGISALHFSCQKARE